MLEHVPDEAAFARELARVTRPAAGWSSTPPPQADAGCAGAPRPRPDRREARPPPPGLHAERLRELLAPAFELERHRSYSRFFSEAVDTALNWGIERLGKASSAKGMVVTGGDLARHRKAFRVYSAIYPFVWAVSGSTRSSPLRATC